MKRLTCAASLVAALLSTATSHAQSSQAAAAEALFQEGLAASERRDFDTACTRFRDSDKLDPANGTKLAIAECEQNRGKVATSWSLFKATLDLLPPTDKRIGAVKQRVADLEARLPKLVVKLAPDAPKGTTVTEAGVRVPSSAFGLALPTDPGPHTFVVEAEGYEPATLTVEAKEKQTVTLEARPGAKAAMPVATPVRAAPAAPAPAAERPESVVAVASAPSSEVENESSGPIAGWVVGGAGVLALGVGVTSYFLAVGKRSVAEENCSVALQRCNADGKAADDAVETLNVVTLVGLGLGAVGVGVGAWLVADANAEGPPKTGWQMGPTVGSQGAGWNVKGTW